MPLHELEREKPGALAAFTAFDDRFLERRAQLVGPLDRELHALAARAREIGGEHLRAFVVEARYRRQVDARTRHALLQRALEALELRRAMARQLAGDRDVAAPCGGRLARGRLVLLFPRRRRALELQQVAHRELIERRAIVRALHQVEQREP